MSDAAHLDLVVVGGELLQVVDNSRDLVRDEDADHGIPLHAPRIARMVRRIDPTWNVAQSRRDTMFTQIKRGAVP